MYRLYILYSVYIYNGTKPMTSSRKSEDALWIMNPGMSGTYTYMYMKSQSTRQGNSKQLRPKTPPFFSREKTCTCTCTCKREYTMYTCTCTVAPCTCTHTSKYSVSHLISSRHSVLHVHQQPIQRQSKYAHACTHVHVHTLSH